MENLDLGKKDREFSGKFCENCGTGGITKEATVCNNCGCQFEETINKKETINNKETVNNKEEKKYNSKFCKYCGEQIAKEAVICIKCGCQVEEIRNNEQPQVVINNNNSNANRIYGRAKNKWIAFALCFIIGYIGAHKFYEGKIGLGILYLFTGGLFGLGWIIDCVILLLKPNTYYV